MKEKIRDHRRVDFHQISFFFRLNWHNLSRELFLRRLFNNNTLLISILCFT